MLSRLVDIPVSVLPIGVRWTVSWIVLLSVLYTYLVNRLTQDAEPYSPHGVHFPDPVQKTYYIAHVRRMQAEKRALDEKRRKIVEQEAFRLLDLPAELSGLVLAHAADWPETYRALVQASKRCQSLTVHACLPHMPVRLVTAAQLRSFHTLLRARPELACLVHRLWATPLKEELLPTTIDIVRRCTNLRALASTAHIVESAITLRSSDAWLSHSACTDLTLLAARTGAWAALFATPHGRALFARLERLRLIGDRVPNGMPLPRLTHHSYGTSEGGIRGGGFAVGLAMLADRAAYPALQGVVFTRARGSAGGLRVSRPVPTARLFVLDLPATHTELEIWCDSASRRGMWELCADPQVHGSPSSHH